MMQLKMKLMDPLVNPCYEDFIDINFYVRFFNLSILDILDISVLPTAQDFGIFWTKFIQKNRKKNIF